LEDLGGKSKRSNILVKKKNTKKRKLENRSIKKIVVLGPESTGKSTLCAALAKQYDTIWCPEYARQYLHENGTKYNYEDLLTVAKGQLAGEDEAIADALIAKHNGKAIDKIIIDTDMYVMKVWCEYVFNNCHTYILEQINERKYDAYILCDIDLPWTADEMREYPDAAPRKELFTIYKEILINQNTPWGIVSGLGEQRTQNAIQLIEQLLIK
jgi:NadR type nicotinamide-nucleotide adenylyltransferase